MTVTENLFNGHDSKAFKNAHSQEKSLLNHHHFYSCQSLMKELQDLSQKEETIPLQNQSFEKSETKSKVKLGNLTKMADLRKQLKCTLKSDETIVRLKKDPQEELMQAKQAVSLNKLI